jgi:hypothetical protein
MSNGEAEREFIANVTAAMARLLLFDPPPRGWYDRDIAERLVVDGITVRCGEGWIEFSASVRHRVHASKVGTASFGVVSPLPPGLLTDHAAENVVETFLVQLSEDVMSSGAYRNHLRWDDPAP